MKHVLNLTHIFPIFVGYLCIIPAFRCLVSPSDIARSVTALGFGAEVMEDDETAGSMEICIKVTNFLLQSRLPTL